MKYTHEVFTKLYTEKLSDLDISILINNVGVAGHGELLDMSEETLHSLIVVNSYAATLLTKEVVASFKRRWSAKKRSSLICNTSAIASHGACTWLQTYCASKKYTDFLAYGLQYELGQYGVDVCAWRPASVSTSLVPGSFKKDPMSVTPEQLVEACFNKCTSGVHHGHWKHELVGLIIDNMEDLLPWFGKFFMKKASQMLRQGFEKDAQSKSK